jgi:hypothetical protein
MTQFLCPRTDAASSAHSTPTLLAVWAGRRALLLTVFLLTVLCAYAQSTAPAWSLAASGSLRQFGGTSLVQATALDASGNLLVTGSFTGTVAFGDITLTSQGDQDVFLAKYVPATGAWAWVLPAGGSGADVGRALAVSSTGIYLTGNLTNDQANSRGVIFASANSSQAQNGASATSSRDVFVAKYEDTGTGAELRWVTVGGGSGDDLGYGVALNGGSVYVAGTLTNNTSNATNALFGNSGNVVGTSIQYGASSSNSSDVLVVKYTDNGTAANLDWTQVGGGTGNDAAYGLAASGNNLYLTGVISNSLADVNSVRFGGSGATAGTTSQLGASTANTGEVLVAKYVDNGTTGSLSWTQVAGGRGTDQGFAVAASGNSVYVTGVATNNRADNNAVRLGGSGPTPGTTVQVGASTTVANDLLLLKYSDQGSSADVSWSQVAGGTGNDIGFGLVVSGTSVYVTGYLINNAADANAVVFGGTGTTVGNASQVGAASGTSSQDVVVARYTDNGTTATFNWSQVGGGTGLDYGYGLAVTATMLYIGGYVSAGAPLTFGAATGSPLYGTISTRGMLGQLAPTTGAWQRVTATANGGTSSTTGVATDAQGNVFVTGSFSGQIDFGSTRLSSVGGSDLFVAKYVPSTDTWAWAQSGGGTDTDQGYGIAVSGTSVYVTGTLTNNTANANRVLFGGTGTPAGTVQVNGATSTTSLDLLLAKYTDNGSTATLGWTQVGGGIQSDQGYGVAANGTSVYVTGLLYNSSSNSNGVLFGGTGTTAGTVVQSGAGSANNPDLLLAKYTDNGTTATLGWTQVGGGTQSDQGYSVAVSGTSVYVVGVITNNTANTYRVLFGGTGTVTGAVTQTGATGTANFDLVLAKYTDNGSTATLGWTQVGGGTDLDQGYGVAVSGTSVYVTGYIYNNSSNSNGVLFGGTGTTAGTVPQNGATGTASQDLLLVKYTDTGTSATLDWTQVGGGTSDDRGRSVAVRGSTVYVTGSIYNTANNSNGVLFGGTGTAVGTVPQSGVTSTAGYDLVLAKYTDNGASAILGWTQVGGGPSTDFGYGVAINGQNVLVGGLVTPSVSFGSTIITTPAGSATAVLARLVDNTLTPLPVQLVAFTAQAAGPHAVYLTWATASEKNSARFEVERSVDGVRFGTIGGVVAAGTSSTAHSYSFTDPLLPTGDRVLYYRLRQVDLDGMVTYSPVQVVMLSGGGLALFPNPTAHVATLQGAGAGQVVQVYDAVGRLVLTASADASGTVGLTLPAQLRGGLYVVRVGKQALRLSVE